MFTKKIHAFKDKKKEEKEKKKDTKKEKKVKKEKKEKKTKPLLAANKVSDIAKSPRGALNSQQKAPSNLSKEEIEAFKESQRKVYEEQQKSTAEAAEKTPQIRSSSASDLNAEDPKKKKKSQSKRAPSVSGGLAPPKSKKFGFHRRKKSDTKDIVLDPALQSTSTTSEKTTQSENKESFVPAKTEERKVPPRFAYARTSQDNNSDSGTDTETKNAINSLTISKRAFNGKASRIVRRPVGEISKQLANANAARALLAGAAETPAATSTPAPAPAPSGTPATSSVAVAAAPANATPAAVSPDKPVVAVSAVQATANDKTANQPVQPVQPAEPAQSGSVVVQPAAVQPEVKETPKEPESKDGDDDDEVEQPFYAGNSQLTKKLEQDALVLVSAMHKRQVEKQKEEPGEQPTLPTGVPPPPDPSVNPPPPPGEPPKVTKVTMSAVTEDYPAIFGVTVEYLEQTLGIHRWRIENLMPVYIGLSFVDPKDAPTPLDSSLDGSESEIVIHKPNQFFVKDCYLVLHITEEDNGKLKQSSRVDAVEEIGTGSLQFSLFYLVGSSASTDKLGSMCFRAVQLNTMIGGRAKHCKEDQSEESDEFLSLWKNYIDSDLDKGLLYSEGGTESAFRKVKNILDEFEVPVLYKFFKKFGVIVMERISLSIESLLDPKGVYMLDTGGLDIFQLNGINSAKAIQFKCNEIVKLINVQERKSKIKLDNLNFLSQNRDMDAIKESRFWSLIKSKDSNNDSISNFNTFWEFWQPIEDEKKRKAEELRLLKDAEEKAKFLEQEKIRIAIEKAIAAGEPIPEQILSGPPPPPSSAPPSFEEDTSEEDFKNSFICELYEISEVNGEMDVQVVWKQSKEEVKPSKDKYLKPVNIYILDCGNEAFVYCGAKAPKRGRQLALLLAENVLSDESKTNLRNSSLLPVVPVLLVDREEGVIFKFKFNGWMEGIAKKGLGAVDFRDAHQKMLDDIKKRKKAMAKKGENFEEKVAEKNVPIIDPAKLFPEIKSVPQPTTTSGNTNNNNNNKENTKDINNNNNVNKKDPGAIEVGTITSSKTFTKVTDDEKGLLCGSECYVILNTFIDRVTKMVTTPTLVDEGNGQIVLKETQVEVVEETEKWKIYFWQGKEAGNMKWPTFTLGILPLLKENIILSGYEPPDVERIYQGKETAEYVELFNNKIVTVRKGDRKLVVEEGLIDNKGFGKTYLLEIQIPEEIEISNVEGGQEIPLLLVEAVAELGSLKSSGLFIVSWKNKKFLWAGKAASKDLKKYFETKSELLKKHLIQTIPGNNEISEDFIIVEEGKENIDFWTAMCGGNEELAQVKAKELEQGSTEERGHPRLLAMFYSPSGAFVTKEISNFTQNDLSTDHAYLLNNGIDGDGLYVWTGLNAVDLLKSAAIQVSQSYAEWLMNNGKKFRFVEEMKEGEEDESFTKWFGGWTRKVWIDPYEIRMKEFRKREAEERLLEQQRQNEEAEKLNASQPQEKPDQVSIVVQQDSSNCSPPVPEVQIAVVDTETKPEKVEEQQQHVPEVQIVVADEESTSVSVDPPAEEEPKQVSEEPAPLDVPAVQVTEPAAVETPAVEENNQVSEEPVPVEVPAEEEPKPVPEEPEAEPKPVPEEPAEEPKQVPEEPAAEPPVTAEAPAAEEPKQVSEEPATEAPAAEEPKQVSEEPATEAPEQNSEDKPEEEPSDKQEFISEDNQPTDESLQLYGQVEPVEEEPAVADSNEQDEEEKKKKEHEEKTDVDAPNSTDSTDKKDDDDPSGGSASGSGNSDSGSGATDGDSAADKTSGGADDGDADNGGGDLPSGDASSGGAADEESFYFRLDDEGDFFEDKWNTKAVIARKKSWALIESTPGQQWGSVDTLTSIQNVPVTPSFWKVPIPPVSEDDLEQSPWDEKPEEKKRKKKLRLPRSSTLKGVKQISITEKMLDDSTQLKSAVVSNFSANTSSARVTEDALLQWEARLIEMEKSLKIREEIVARREQELGL